MAKTRGPLYSINAQGTVGKTIIFQKGIGLTKTKQYRKPNQPDSAAQLSLRNIVKQAVQKWQSLPSTIKNVWQQKTTTIGKTWSGYNYFTSEYVKNMHLGLPPLVIPPKYIIRLEPHLYPKYWEGSGEILHDSSFYQNHGDINKFVEWAAFDDAYSLYYNLTGPIYRTAIPHHSSLDPKDGPMTIMGWYRAEPPGATHIFVIIAKMAFNPGTFDLTGYVLTLDASNNLAFIYINGALPGDALYIYDKADNIWHHVAATVDTKNLKLKIYFDGQLTDEGPIIYNPGSISNDVFVLSGGAYDWMPAAGFDPAPGYSSLIKYFDKVLTDEEIFSIYYSEKP